MSKVLLTLGILLTGCANTGNHEPITELELYCFNQDNLSYMDCIEVHKIAKEQETMKLEENHNHNGTKHE